MDGERDSHIIHEEVPVGRPIFYGESPANYFVLFSRGKAVGRYKRQQQDLLIYTGKMSSTLISNVYVDFLATIRFLINL